MRLDPKKTAIVVVDLKEKQLLDILAPDTDWKDTNIEFINTGKESCFKCNIFPINHSEPFIVDLSTDKYIALKANKDSYITVVLGYGGEINKEKDVVSPKAPHITMHTVDRVYKLLDTVNCDHDNIAGMSNDKIEADVTINKMFATLSFGGTSFNLIADTNKGFLLLSCGRTLVDPEYLAGMNKYKVGETYKMTLRRGIPTLKHIILNNQSKVYPAIIETKYIIEK